MSRTSNSVPHVPALPHLPTARSLIGGLVALWWFAPWGKAAVQYRVQDLGSFDPTAINDKGQVVGYQQTSPGHAYFYDGSKLIDLTETYGLAGPLGGAPWGLNNQAQIAGDYPIDTTASNTGVTRGYLFANGKLTDLGTLGGYSIALKVSGNGQAVGSSNLTSVETDPYYPVLFSGGKVIQLSPSPGTAAAINSSGQVVGDYKVGNDSHAFLYASGTFSDLGTLGGADSAASAINDLGQIVGSSGTASGTRDVFLYQNGKMTDLGHVIQNGAAIPTYAYGINNSGTIFGDTLNPGEASPFVYQNGRFFDLNSLIDPKLGINFVWVSGINDAGQLAVLGNSTSSPPQEAYLLTPIPEPTAALLFPVAAGLLARHRRVQNRCTLP